MKKENLEVLLEDINSKFQFVVESHEALRSEIHDLSRRTDERFDLFDFKFDTLNKKIDAIADDLSAHRADTEAHHGAYRIMEREG
ncbi:hypothetical protein [Geomonas oryzae]|uniref:hypothetical protein n=1 Tax=Geomonas oryzae TaxID=2364273 RepID=UPI0018E073D3|nr:hypothetical protein [Geomonas oryzae]